MLGISFSTEKVKFALSWDTNVVSKIGGAISNSIIGGKGCIGELGGEIEEATTFSILVKAHCVAIILMWEEYKILN